MKKLSLKIGLLLLVNLLASCRGDRKPADILSHDEMVRTLTEVYIGEQKVGQLNLPTDSAKIVFEKIRGRIFEHAGVPDSVFKKSFDYYMDKPLELEQIYTALVDSLNLREQRLNISSRAAKESKEAEKSK